MEKPKPFTGHIFTRAPDLDSVRVYIPTYINDPSRTIYKLPDTFSGVWLTHDSLNATPSRWTQIKSFLTGHIGWRALLR